MKIFVLQHAAYEGPGEIGMWAKEHGHELAIYHLYCGDTLPLPGGCDLLVVLGGEMNIYQDRDWPWLKAERAFIRATLEGGGRVVGICLGAQLIADALGARVTQNPEFEVGWLPIRWTDEARAFFPELEASAIVLHWHGDTFGLPPGALRLAANDGCAEQGFVVEGKCLGLQFHLEVDPALVKLYVASQGDWPAGAYVQAPEKILSEAAIYSDKNRRLLHGLLDRFCGPTIS